VVVIRVETADGWRLVTHPEHARLAGEIARHWKNDAFLPPDPFAHVLDAVSRHDDSWADRDSNPELDDDGRPSAFSRDLVGEYEAFENVDLDGYLRVRAEATEAAADRDPYAAVLISMHTVNLLDEQADPSALDPPERDRHASFLADQRERQAELKRGLRNRSGRTHVSDADFRRAFEFLQACDSLSLYLCVDYDEPGQLRHAQPRRDGEHTPISYLPRDDRRYALEPWPFDEDELTLSIPYRHVRGEQFDSVEAFRERYHAAALEPVDVQVIPA
jgi:hypothetical protein